MDQSELFGRVIKVAAAKPQKEGNEGLGSKVAVWEQVSDYDYWMLAGACGDYWFYCGWCWFGGLNIWFSDDD